MHYWNNNNNNCYIKEIMIAHFINSFPKFNKMLCKTQKIVSLRQAICLATLGFFLQSYMFFQIQTLSNMKSVNESHSINLLSNHSTLVIACSSSCHQKLECPGFKLSILWLRNVIYFSIIAMSKKSHFTIFAIQTFVQNTNVFVIIHLHCWDHVCKANEWCLEDCFHPEFRLSTQMMLCYFALKSFPPVMGF